jgi:1-phosphofructokinase
MVEGHVNRATRVETYLAGKGINVARNLSLAGNLATAVVPINAEDLELAEGSESMRNKVFRVVDVTAPTRVNAIIVDTDGATTNFNESAAPLSPEKWQQLCEATLHEIDRVKADWLVLGGSLPVDISTGREVDPGELFRTAHRAGVATCLDTSGETLKAWTSPATPVDLVKPNKEELADLTGIQLRTMRDVVFAANLLRRRGIRTVLASLGSDGIVEVNEHEVLWARGPAAKVLNTTGAGDAALAGYLSALPHASAAPYTQEVVCEALARAVAWGALAVQEPTTILPRVVFSPAGLTVSAPDPDYVLSR